MESNQQTAKTNVESQWIMDPLKFRMNNEINVIESIEQYYFV